MTSHFSEIVLVCVLIIMLGFVVFMNVQHNDSLAAKGMEFAGQGLAALAAVIPDRLFVNAVLKLPLQHGD